MFVEQLPAWPPESAHAQRARETKVSIISVHYVRLNSCGVYEFRLVFGWITFAGCY